MIKEFYGFLKHKFTSKPKISLTWYVENDNKFNCVRVIRIDTDSFNNIVCEYRTIEDIVSIENDPANSMSIDDKHLIDIREAGFRCQSMSSLKFSRLYRQVEDMQLEIILEARYRNALSRYETRLEQNKLARMNEDERREQNRLNNFLEDPVSNSINRNYVDANGKIRIPQENGRSRTNPANMSGTTHVNIGSIVSGSMTRIGNSWIELGAGGGGAGGVGNTTNPYGGTADLSHVGDRANPDQQDAGILNRVDPEVAMLLEELDRRNKQIDKPVEEEIVPETQKKLEKIN